MPQSLASLLTHLIFSTKNRKPLLYGKDLQERTHAYLATVLNDLKCPTVIVGGVANHVHILCQLAKTKSVSDVMEHLKASSSKWLKTQGSHAFSWQRGYGVFSVSQSLVAAVVRYIERQEEHHRTITFEEEYRSILKGYRVVFDERYVWD
ncbi:MAG: IS200/IS605 family transposase [Chthoniobacterales bacterium]